MNDLNEYNIPKSSEECWERYPKYNWVYNRSRLFDSQHIAWSPFKTSVYSCELNMFTSFNNQGTIYVLNNEDIDNELIITDAIIQNGDLKWFSHHKDLVFYDHVIGEVDLHIHAFTALYLQKFTGAVSFKTHSNHIYEISLFPTDNMLHKYPTDAIKLIKKVYKRK